MKGVMRKQVIPCFLIIVLLLSTLCGCKGESKQASKAQGQIDTALLHISEGEYDEAIMSYQEALQIDPNELQIYQGLARAYALQNDTPSALDTYAEGIEILNEQDAKRLKLCRAGMYLEKEQYREAEEAFEKIIAEDSSCIEAYQGLWNVNWLSQGDYDQRLEIAERAVEANSDDWRAYSVYFSKENLLKSISLNKNQHSAYTSHNWWFDKYGDLSLLRYSVSSDILGSVEYSEEERMLTMNWLKKTGNPDKVLKIYKDFFNEDDTNYKAQVFAAECLLKTGEDDQAKKMINQLSKQEKDLNEWIMADIARLYLLVGDDEEALKWAEKSYNLNQTNTIALGIMSEIYAKTDNPRGKITAARAFISRWTPLDISIIYASAEGNAEEVELLIKAGANPDYDSGGPLAFAILYGDAGTVDILLDYGANPNNDDDEPLIIACMIGDIDKVNLLLDGGAYANCRDGLSLEISCKDNKNTEIIKALLDAGADPNKRRLLISGINIPGYDAFEKGTKNINLTLAEKESVEITRILLEAGADPNDGGALWYAAHMGYKDVVDMLLQAGADPLWIGDRGQTALMAAAFGGNMDVFNTLLDKGCNPAACDENGKKALMYAAEGGSAEIFQSLIEQGEDPAVRSTDGKTLLMFAAEGGSQDIVQSLLDTGLDYSLRDESGYTALLYGAKAGADEAVKLLLDAGADPETRDYDYLTALMIAVKNGNVSIVETLINAGADVNAYTEDKFTVLLMAAQQGDAEIVKMLLDAGADPNLLNIENRTALMWAIHVGNVNPLVVKVLLDAGAEYTFRDIYGNTALQYGVQVGSEEVVDMLLKAGADPNERDDSDWTALMKAAGNGNTGIVRLLLEAGADPDKKESWVSHTAIMLAAQEGHNEVVKALVEAGANIQVRSDKGYTALIYASRGGHTEVVKTLLAAGANVHAETNDGYTALSVAQNNGFYEIADLLREAGARE